MNSTKRDGIYIILIIDTQILQKVQLYLLGIIAALKLDYNSLSKQLKDDGKHEKEYFTQVLINIGW